MFTRNFEEMVREMQREMIANMEAGGTNRVAEGRRIENVNGERREYELVDGEWEEVTNDSPHFELSDNTLTVDLSTMLPATDFEASATFNNGVLEVTFEKDE